MLKNVFHVNSTHKDFSQIELIARLDVWEWPHRCDGLGIDIFVTLGIILFDVLEVGRLPESKNIPV